jgi:hypothetical protein
VDAGVSVARNPQFSWVVERDEVQGLLSGTIECDSFTLPITYDILGDADVPSADRLFAEVDAANLLRAEPSPGDIQRHSRPLEWCSATGSGELVRIQQACLALGIPASEWGGAWSVLRRLVLLGHFEFAGGSLRWSAIPPTLVAPDEDSDRLQDPGGTTNSGYNQLPPRWIPYRRAPIRRRSTARRRSRGSWGYLLQARPPSI